MIIKVLSEYRVGNLKTVQNLKNSRISVYLRILQHFIVPQNATRHWTNMLPILTEVILYLAI